MTELEKRIYKCALEILPKLENKVQEIQTEARYISVPFFCDGVVDLIIYDTAKKQFTKIEYTKGKGQGTIFEPSLNNHSAYYDEVELCSFDIPNKGQA